MDDAGDGRPLDCLGGFKALNIAYIIIAQMDLCAEFASKTVTWRPTAWKRDYRPHDGACSSSGRNVRCATNISPSSISLLQLQYESVRGYGD